MARIHKLKVKNFRCLSDFVHTFGSTNLNCLIGRGDSGKSTILEAIFLALSPNRLEIFYDEDFHNSNIHSPIEIEVTLLNLPNEFFKHGRFDGYFKIFDPRKNEISEQVDTYEPEETTERALTVKLEVANDLEPNWTIQSGRSLEPKIINYTDRKKLNVFYVSDAIDRHFTWSKWNPLHRLLQEDNPAEGPESELILDVIRSAKAQINDGDFEKFDATIKRVLAQSKKFGVDIPNLSTRIDSRDLFARESRFSLHDDGVPFRQKGKGSKRLTSIAIQTALVATGGIVLIDEIEQSLEPDRAKHAVSTLKDEKHGQIFMTTHSRDVVVELNPGNLLLARKNQQNLTTFSDDLAGFLRANPEAFFGGKIIVCEGKTELGICRALDQYMVEKGFRSFSSLDIATALGEGSTSPKYVYRFKESGFNTCVFCDSEEENFNREKPGFAAANISVFDWENKDMIERAFFRDIPKDAISELLKYRAKRLAEKKNITPNEAAERMWEGIIAQYGVNAKSDYNLNEIPENLRLAIADVANNKDWFKNITDGQILGEITFNYFDHIKGSSLEKVLTKLINWIYH